jgi:hypothetical protein
MCAYQPQQFFRKGFDHMVRISCDGQKDQGDDYIEEVIDNVKRGRNQKSRGRASLQASN